jgi:hypothetical protein
MLGRKHTAETLKKMSELSTGRTFSEEVRKKNSEAQKGKKLTAETRANMSLGKTGEKNPSPPALLQGGVRKKIIRRD